MAHSYGPAPAIGPILIRNRVHGHSKVFRKNSRPRRRQPIGFPRMSGLPNVRFHGTREPRRTSRTRKRYTPGTSPDTMAANFRHRSAMPSSRQPDSGFLAPPLRPEACELCGRPSSELTRHHLIPRTRHSNRRTRRQFDRNELSHRILWVCRPCHSHIHASITEKDLERHYHTRERLLDHPEVERFVRWIREKPADFKPRSTSRRR